VVAISRDYHRHIDNICHLRRGIEIRRRRRDREICFRIHERIQHLEMFFYYHLDLLHGAPLDGRGLRRILSTLNPLHQAIIFAEIRDFFASVGFENDNADVGSSSGGLSGDTAN